MNIIKKIGQRGFTLVEMLLYMGLLSILLLIFANIFTTILETQLSSQSTGAVTQDGRFIYSRLIYDINRAQSVSLPATLGAVSSALQMQINGSAYLYELNNGNLQLTDPNGTAVLNSYDTTISGLQFKRIGNINGKDTFQINFVVTGNIQLPGPAESESFQTTAGLR